MLKTTTVAGAVAFTWGLLAGSPQSVSAQTPNVVIQWNHIAQTLFTPVPGPSIRWLPALHIAMFRFRSASASSQSVISDRSDSSIARSVTPFQTSGEA